MSDISIKGNMLHIGAAARLNDLLALPELPAVLHALVQQEPAGEQAALAYIAAAPGSARLAAAMLALDAELEYTDGRMQSYGNLLALRASGIPDGLAALRFSLLAALQYHEADGAWLALARWPSGRTRVALGGWGPAPILAMDGRDPSGILEAAENTLMLASNGAPEDEARMQAVRHLADTISFS